MLQIGSSVLDIGLVENENFFSVYLTKKGLILLFINSLSSAKSIIQICNLRDNFKLLNDSGFRLLAITYDNDEEIGAAVLTHLIPFEIIGDQTHVLGERFGIVEKQYNNSAPTLLLKRATFLISSEGIVIEIIEKIDYREHSEQILALFKSLLHD